jgi:hypothetical protein
MKVYPKVRSVSILADKRLLIGFDTGARKIYDCAPQLREDAFRPLKEDWLFRSVQADASGHGISWNEEIDLSESELWENGFTP